ncbi:Homeobox-DDT domain protein RLT3 [Vitis vinifera]|uniref:Homeobox-DDT domain protein RLT3 n=1 Tax=Vitis vinifera TaxID=29760 RepID=A0A438DH11_VITVI|nr:Homeobox-DDT domain protein RLT3 [Vitis vinifera]
MMTFEDRKSPVIELQGDVCFLTSHDVNQKEFLRCFLGNPSERALADSYKIMGWGIRAFLEGSDFKVASLEGLKIPRELGLDVGKPRLSIGWTFVTPFIFTCGHFSFVQDFHPSFYQDLTKAVVEYVPNIHHYGSGAKIKRSYTKQHNLPTPAWGHFGQMLGGKEIDTSSELCPVDSSTSISKFHGKEKFSSKRKETREAEVGLDLHPMQSVFLGPDRRYNRYWLFLGPCNANDPGHKRVYFESSEDGHWEVIDTEEAFCALLSVLDGRGKREAFLLASLEKRKASLCQEMSSRIAIHSGSTSLTQYDRSDLYMIREDSSSPVSDIVDNPCATDITNDFLASSGAIVLGVGKKGEEQKQRWRRLQEFDAWIWSAFYSDLNAVKHGKRTYLDSLARCESCHDLYWRDEKHCKTCHTTFELDFDLEEKYAIHIATCREKEDNDMFPKHKVLSSQLQSLKAAIHAIESVMPEDALVEAWSKSAHKLWVRRLRRTSYLTELLQVLADFVGAIKEDWLCQSDVVLGSNNLLEEIVVSFSTMPQTSSAVALWLVKLDALIAPHLERVQLHSKKRTRN